MVITLPCKTSRVNTLPACCSITSSASWTQYTDPSFRWLKHLTELECIDFHCWIQSSYGSTLYCSNLYCLSAILLYSMSFRSPKMSRMKIHSHHLYKFGVSWDLVSCSQKKEADSGLLPFEHAVYLAVMVLSAALPPEEWTVGTLGTAILHTKRYMVHVMSSDLLRFWPQLAMDGTGSQWRSINDDDDACVPGVSPCSNVTR